MVPAFKSDLQVICANTGSCELLCSQLSFKMGKHPGGFANNAKIRSPFSNFYQTNNGRSEATSIVHLISTPIPFERSDNSILYNEWMVHHAFTIYGVQALAADWLKSFKEFPPRQKPASFNLDEVMRKMSEPAAN